MIGEPNLFIIGMCIFTFTAGMILSVYGFVTRFDVRVVKLTMFVAGFGLAYLIVAVVTEPILASHYETGGVTAIQHIGFWIGLGAVLIYIHYQRI